MDAGPLTIELRSILVRNRLTVEELAGRLGMDSSRLGKLVNGRQKTVTLELADRILTRWDGLNRLDDLYPFECES